MKKAFSFVLAFLAGKLGCSCMLVMWALIFLLGIVPITIILMALGVPYDSMRWIFRTSIFIELILFAGSIIF